MLKLLHFPVKVPCKLGQIHTHTHTNRYSTNDSHKASFEKRRTTRDAKRNKILFTCLYVHISTQYCANFIGGTAAIHGLVYIGAIVLCQKWWKVEGPVARYFSAKTKKQKGKTKYMKY